MYPNCNDVHFLGPWVWKQMGDGLWSPDDKSCMGFIDDRGPRWAVVYDHYEEGGSIQMHVAISDRKSISRRAIFAVFEYPFYQLGVKKVLAVVNSNNHAALTLDLRLGFEVECVIKDAYSMGDMYILSMTPKQCRWIRGISDGKQQKAAEAA